MADGVKLSMSALGQARYSAEYSGRLWVVSFLKHKCRQTKLAGSGVKVYRRFFHSIATKTSAYTPCPGVLCRYMGEHPTNLSHPGTACLVCASAIEKAPLQLRDNPMQRTIAGDRRLTISEYTA